MALPRTAALAVALTVEPFGDPHLGERGQRAHVVNDPATVHDRIRVAALDWLRTLIRYCAFGGVVMVDPVSIVAIRTARQ